MKKYFLLLNVYLCLSIVSFAQDQVDLSDNLKLINGILAINAKSISGEDSFFQLSEKRSKKTVFWEVFREKGTLKRNYAVERLPKGVYNFQFALDGKALYGEVSNVNKDTSLKVYHSADYKRPYFNANLSEDTLSLDGFFAQDEIVEISIKNENEDEDAYNVKVNLDQGKLKTEYILSDLLPGFYVVRAKLKDRTFVRNFNLK
ncbi:hypothetical protein EI427_14405 [Flammeovirga pectinis]|uniref:T9SS type A sorting domain-containing protein n=1 Tax=Flammeovirga pectinis TaxID=2494373 RepID=A0A3Q9FM96_9BACT|nr:hypothetical protein [Flammeovirga pectinis]AZQ63379.1 hypothetical protein EI427_14405 [Flammeovirga pectinis]